MPLLTATSLSAAASVQRPKSFPSRPRSASDRLQGSASTGLCNFRSGRLRRSVPRPFQRHRTRAPLRPSCRTSALDALHRTFLWHLFRCMRADPLFSPELCGLGAAECHLEYWKKQQESLHQSPKRIPSFKRQMPAGFWAHCNRTTKAITSKDTKVYKGSQRSSGPPFVYLRALCGLMSRVCYSHIC